MKSKVIYIEWKSDYSYRLWVYALDSDYENVSQLCNSLVALKSGTVSRPHNQNKILLLEHQLFI